MDNIDNLHQRVRELIADELSWDITQVLPDSRLQEDLQADSLDFVEMVMRAEDEFDIEIDDEEAEKVVSVADAVLLIEKLVQA